MKNNMNKIFFWDLYRILKKTILLYILCVSFILAPARFASSHILTNNHSISLRLKWSKGPKLPKGFGGQAMLNVDGKVICVGGVFWKDHVKYCRDQILVLSEDMSKWLPQRLFPIPVGYSSSASGGVDAIVVGGITTGGHAIKNAWQMGPLGKWNKLPPLPQPRVYGSAAIMNGHCLIIGGVHDLHHLGRISSQGVILDLSDTENGWQALPPIPTGPRSLFASAVIGKKIYIFGGMQQTKQKLKNLSQVWSYDPSACRWKQLASLPLSNRGAIACAYNDRWIILIGGYVSQNGKSSYSNQVLAYDTLTSKYITLTPLPMPIITRAAILNNKIIVAGGEDRPGHRTDKCWIGTLTVIKHSGHE